jgi:rhodanese-related sulfurtransferase
MSGSAGVPPEIDIDGAISRVAAGEHLIDVREVHEWDAGHAPSALLLPMSEIRERLNELPEGPLLIICHSGARSARVSDFLAQSGYPVTNVLGGMSAWIAAGGPVTAGA